MLLIYRAAGWFCKAAPWQLSGIAEPQISVVSPQSDAIHTGAQHLRCTIAIYRAPRAACPWPAAYEHGKYRGRGSARPRFIRIKMAATNSEIQAKRVLPPAV